MCRGRKVCVLRVSAEVEALAELIRLRDLVRDRHVTEAEARPLADALKLPDCAEHRHVSKREARRMERAGGMSFLSGWGEQYAAEGVSHGRRFYPDRIFSGDQAIGRLEMYER